MIYTYLWSWTEMWQLCWWQRLGFQVAVPGYTAMQISWIFTIATTRIFLRAARNSIGSECELSASSICDIPPEAERSSAQMITRLLVQNLWFGLEKAGFIVFLDLARLWWCEYWMGEPLN